MGIAIIFGHNLVLNMHDFKHVTFGIYWRSAIYVLRKNDICLVVKVALAMQIYQMSWIITSYKTKCFHWIQLYNVPDYVIYHKLIGLRRMRLWMSH